MVNISYFMNIRSSFLQFCDAGKKWLFLQFSRFFRTHPEQHGLVQKNSDLPVMGLISSVAVQLLTGILLQRNVFFPQHFTLFPHNRHISLRTFFFLTWHLKVWDMSSNVQRRLGNVPSVY